MRVERSQLVTLLRSRYSHTTAQRAERSLPQHVDLDRDRGLLRQCGIDPNVLAVILSVEDRVAAPTETLPQPSVAADHLELDRAPADSAPRMDRAERWLSGRGTRKTAATEAASTKWFRRRSPATSSHDEPYDVQPSTPAG